MRAILSGFLLAFGLYLAAKMVRRIGRIVLHPGRKVTARFMRDFPSMPMPPGVQPASGILDRLLAHYTKPIRLFEESQSH